MNIEKELERIAKAWDGCKTQALGGEDDVGKLLRYEFKRVLSPLGAGTTAGWKLVPYDATVPMIQAGIDALGGCIGSCGEASPPTWSDINDCFGAMVSAAPTLPEAAAQEGDSTDELSGRNIPQWYAYGEALVAAKKAQKPSAYLVEGRHNGKLIAHQLFFKVDEAANLASGFAKHYPTVNTIPLFK